MNLTIVGIADRGLAFQERLHLLAKANVDLTFYIVFDTISLGDLVANRPKHTFWFPHYEVKAGDNIVLYTGPGTQSRTVRPDGGKDHFFYWGNEKTLWQDSASRAVLFEIAEWATGG